MIEHRVFQWILTTAMLALAVLLPWAWLQSGLTPDFTIFWTAGRFALHSPELVYNSDAMTAAQAWIRDIEIAPLPFVYPPTTLLLLTPFALLPYWVSFAAWSVGGAFVFWTAVRRIISGWGIPLSFATPHVVLVLVLGQTTLWSASAIFWSLSLLKSRPFLAGALMGVAAAIKPQTALLAPILFATDRNWVALRGAAIAWLGLAIASYAFGPGLWIDWLRGIANFQQILVQWELYPSGATPMMAARALGFGSAGTTIIGLAGILCGLLIAWRGWKSDDLQIKVLTFVSGTILASPYAMRYELAMLAPVMAGAILAPTPRRLLIGLPMFTLNAYWIAPTLLLANIAALWNAPFRRRSKALA